MATGAKIGIVLGLLLIVICFVRILDRDISDEVGQTDGEQSLASASPSDQESTDGFSTLGEGDSVDSEVDPVDTAPAGSEVTGSDAIGGEAAVDPSTTENPSHTEFESAGLREVRGEDRDDGFVGRSDSEDPFGRDESNGDATAVAMDLPYTIDPENAPDAGPTDVSRDGATKVAVADLNDPWPMGGDTDAGLTSPDELFRWMEGDDGDRDRPNPGLGPQPAVDPSDVVTSTPDGGEEASRGALDSNSEAERVDARDNRDDTPAVIAGFPTVHTVVENDTLWDIARHFYGKPLLFREIIKANAGMTETSLLRVGRKITIPAPPVAAAAAERGSRPASVRGGESTRSRGGKTYTVVKGDNLYKIAERLFGKGYRWTEIAKQNPNIDPDNLRIGEVLELPKG